MATKNNELVENTAIKQDCKKKVANRDYGKKHFLFTVSDKTSVFLEVNRNI